MTGHVPFDAPTVEEVIIAQVQTPLTPPNLVVPEITQPTSDALVRALAKNPAERFSELRRIHHVAHRRAQPIAGPAISDALRSGKTQGADELVEAAIKKAGVAARRKSPETILTCRWRLLVSSSFSCRRP